MPTPNRRYFLENKPSLLTTNSPDTGTFTNSMIVDQHPAARVPLAENVGTSICSN